MTEQVVVGVDGSEASRRAVQLAADVAKTRGFRMVIVHVIPWSPYSFNTPTENEERHERKQAELQAAMDQVVQPMVALAHDMGITPDTVIKHGQPADVIVELSEETATRYIFLGRTGDSVVRQAVFGSMPIRIIQNAKIPVTVVP